MAIDKMGKDGVVPQASGFDTMGMGRGKKMSPGKSSLNAHGEAKSPSRKLQTQQKPQKFPKK